MNSEDKNHANIKIQRKKIEKPPKQVSGISSNIMKFKFMQGIAGKQAAPTLAEQIQSVKETQQQQSKYTNGNNVDDEENNEDVSDETEPVKEQSKKTGNSSNSTWKGKTDLDDLLSDNFSNKKIEFYKKIRFTKSAPINAKVEGIKLKFDKPKNQ